MWWGGVCVSGDSDIFMVEGCCRSDGGSHVEDGEMEIGAEMRW